MVLVKDKSSLLNTAGDWEKCGGTIGGDYLCRWVPAIKRIDAFRATGAADQGIAGAEILYYCGPYMLNPLRAAGTHFVVAARIVYP